MLPAPVMLEIQKDLLNWQGLNRSVMEISHRSQPFKQMLKQAEADVRNLLKVPDNYQVLFIHGSASHQFSMIPMNIYQPGVDVGKMDYVHSGTWSSKAVEEAKKVGDVNSIEGLIKDEHGHISLKKFEDWDISVSSETAGNESSCAQFLYYTTNETISGVEYQETPDLQKLYGQDVPLIADMSSNIFSKPIDVSKFGLIFAGAQKNIGTSGLTLVIIRDDLLSHADEKLGSLFQYQTYAKHGSLYNTPAVFPLYVAARVFDWIKKQGGLEVMELHNASKAKRLYDFIDGSHFYSNPISKNSRSRMNVPFLLADNNLNELFLSEAEKVGLYGLNGHRSVGGMRASIYNAMPQSGIDALIEFMKSFADDNS